MKRTSSHIFLSAKDYRLMPSRWQRASYFRRRYGRGLVSKPTILSRKVGGATYRRTTPQVIIFEPPRVILLLSLCCRHYLSDSKRGWILLTGCARPFFFPQPPHPPTHLTTCLKAKYQQTFTRRQCPPDKQRPLTKNASFTTTGKKSRRNSKKFYPQTRRPRGGGAGAGWRGGGRRQLAIYLPVPFLYVRTD